MLHLVVLPGPMDTGPGSGTIRPVSKMVEVAPGGMGHLLSQGADSKVEGQKLNDSPM